MKSIHRTNAVAQIGAHRPKAVPNDDWNALNWVGPTGKDMPARFFEGSWRMAQDTAHYDLGQINHYAVRTRESFLLKSTRKCAQGDDTCGAQYWADMDRNEEYDATIQPKLSAMKSIYDDLITDKKLGRLHDRAVQWHSDQIQTVLSTPAGQELFAAISPKLDMFPGLRKRIAA